MYVHWIMTIKILIIKVNLCYRSQVLGYLDNGKDEQVQFFY